MPIATLRIGLDVRGDDGSLPVEYYSGPIRFALGAALGNGDRRTYAISATTFQALTVPTGAKALLLIPEEGATDLTLKGASGDATGVTIRPSSNPIDGPLFTFLGTSPSVGIYNGAAATQSVEAIFI